MIRTVTSLLWRPAMAGKLKARFFPSLVLMYREVSVRLEE